MLWNDREEGHMRHSVFGLKTFVKSYESSKYLTDSVGFLDLLLYVFMGYI